MRLEKYLLNELASDYGAGISFIDIDETIFRTFAKINVIKNGKVIQSLTNQEFNSYELQAGESFDFGEFRSAAIFDKTSIPIPKTINRIKRMLQNIEIRDSKIILLTAREDMDNKRAFLQTFRENGIDVDRMYIERAGNLKTGTIPEKKKKIVMGYLKTGKYRRVRIIDDDIGNIKKFLSINKKIPQSIIDKVKDKHNIPDTEDFPVISFYGLLVKDDGSLKRIT
jgi:hypothetical protein